MPRSAPGNIATTPSLADIAVKTLKDHVARQIAELDAAADAHA